MKDYVVQIKIKNAYMMRYMRSKGIFTAAELSRLTGVSAGLIGDFLNLKRTPYNKFTGDWLPSMLKISEALNVLPAELFPPQHLSKPLEKNTAEVEMNAEELVGIEDRTCDLERLVIKQDRLDDLEKCMSQLPERYRKMLEMNMGIKGPEMTCAEIGDEFGVCSARVAQIIQISKIRLTEFMRKLRKSRRIDFNAKFLEDVS